MKTKRKTAMTLLLVAVIGLLVFSAAAEGLTAPANPFYQTAWSLLPPVIAIALALITKEVYSSLFIGILMGGLLYSNFNFEGTLNHVFNDGIAAVLSTPSNVGILVFLVILGAMVHLMNEAGGSAAFGRWASHRIKTRVGAHLATTALGVMIFVDDYFNCLTVGSVMRPVCDEQKMSRAKLAYIIDATAAPVCIIAPVSSWAAAVASYVKDGNGLELFLRAIPFNFYALLTLVMLIFLAITGMDYGPMKKYEDEAAASEGAMKNLAQAAEAIQSDANSHGKVVDLIFPVAILIVSCITGMIYTGGFFSGTPFIDAFSGCNASVGLMLGSAVTLFITMIYYLLRRSMSFKEIMNSIPEGFKAMIPAILVLTFAWSLKAMTDSLGAGTFVSEMVKSSAKGFHALLPAVVFLIGCFLAFATGTSWGTFGILIPITLSVFPLTDPLGVVCIAACMAGAVCGDHCSPISDTTIMASAGAQCDHVTHVSTQLPYAATVAAVSFVSYIIAGWIPNPVIVLPIAIALMIATLIVLRSFCAKKT